MTEPRKINLADHPNLFRDDEARHTFLREVKALVEEKHFVILRDGDETLGCMLSDTALALYGGLETFHAKLNETLRPRDAFDLPPPESKES